MDPNIVHEAINHLVTEHKDELEQAAGAKLVSPEEFQQLIDKNNATQDDDNTVDLEGWNTVSGVTFEAMNKSIVQQKTSPPTFDYKEDTDEGEISINGNFGEWQLSLGGGGEIIELSVPITKGEYSIQKGKTEILSPCSVQIQVNAKYYPHTDDSQKTKLTVDKQKSVSVISIDPAPKDGLQDAAVTQMLKGWFNNNLGVFQPVFATVDLGAQYDKQLAKQSETQVDWMKPAYTSYAVIVPEVSPTSTNSVFGVLTLIDDDKPSSSLAAQISPYVMPKDSVAAFALSRDKLLKHYLLPSVHLMFQTAKPDDFEISNDNGSITSNKKLTLHKIDMNGHTESPEVDAGKFTLEVNDQFLHISLEDITFPVGGLLGIGQTVKMDYKVKFRLKLDVDGAITLEENIRSASIDTQVDDAAWLTEAKIWVGIGSALLMVVGGVAAVAARASAAAVTLDAAEAGGVAAEGATFTANGLMIMDDDVDAAANTVEEISTMTQVLGNAGRVLKLQEFGVPFSRVAKTCLAVGSVTGFFDAAKSASDGWIKKTFQDEKLNFTKVMQDAIRNTVTWPDGIDDLELKTVKLRNSMVFGYGIKETKGT